MQMYERGGKWIAMGVDGLAFIWGQLKDPAE
jgi:hypothetical protein